MNAEELQEITIALPKQRLKKLEEIARERNSSVSEEAARMIRLSLLRLYPSGTKEEIDRESKEEWKELGRTWREIFRAIFRRVWGK
jgi:lauroyl/myristoyl acyltransferase